MRFQLEWHQRCSVFLLPPDKGLSDVGVDPKKNVDFAQLQRWIGYCEGKSVNKQVRNAVMISVCSTVYKYFLKRVSKVQESTLKPSSSTRVISQDSDSVYYRFCGAAVTAMLHARYKKRRSCKQDQKETLRKEINVLKCIQCTDKSHTPEELKYRDRGHMYFPSVEFLSFFERTCVMENANECTFRQYGPEMIDVALKQIEASQEFQKQFKTLVANSLLQRSAQKDLSKFEPTIKFVYKELSRKLCHTRLVNLLQQKLAAVQGKSTLAGQN